KNYLRPLPPLLRVPLQHLLCPLFDQKPDCAQVKYARAQRFVRREKPDQQRQAKAPSQFPRAPERLQLETPSLRQLQQLALLANALRHEPVEVEEEKYVLVRSRLRCASARKPHSAPLQ